MKKVFVSGTNIISSLGDSVDENFIAVGKGNTGILPYEHHPYSPFSFFASLINDLDIRAENFFSAKKKNYTRLECLCILSIYKALQGTAVDLSRKDTLLMLATTKGNIDVLDKKTRPEFSSGRAYLSEFAGIIGGFFKVVNNPLVVCNACVSGVLALITGARYIRSGKYKTVVVCGGDIVSSFTVAGFQAFKAFGTSPCKPYDEKRDGLSLGEGAGTMILTADENFIHTKNRVTIAGGASSNDANHISGPSRYGDGLAAAIKLAMNESSLDASQIDYISAHGTATPYNDEMECKAMHSVGLQDVPLNSFKGAFGHTLGAAGVIESALAVESITRKTLLPSVGFSTIGVTLPLNVIKAAAAYKIKNVLKTASGFGGCNTALIFTETND